MLRGYGSLKIFIGDVGAAQCIKQPVTHGILQPPHLLLRDDPTLIVLSDTVKGGDLGLDLRHIMRQFLLDLITAKLPAGEPLIQYHSSESLKVTELARYFGYNDKYLSSLFHEGTGMTLKQFILKSKMDSAMAELTDTNHTVSQIAYNVGFQDAHNFSTAFRKLTGMTPGQYRKSYGNRELSFE